MRRAALAAYWAFGFPPPSQTSRIPPTVQYLFVQPPVGHPALPVSAPMGILYRSPPPASGYPRSAPKPHCGAISGLWPIGVYDPSIEVTSDEPDPRSGLQGWKAMEQNPDRSRRDEARYLFHAALLETILVMNGIAQFRIAGFLHRVDSAFDNISDNLFDPPPGITAQWPASEGWPQNVISDLVKEQSLRWPYSEAIELGIQWSGHETGWRANWMLERSTHRMILTAQVKRVTEALEKKLQELKKELKLH